MQAARIARTRLHTMFNSVERCWRVKFKCHILDGSLEVFKQFRNLILNILEKEHSFAIEGAIKSQKLQIKRVERIHIRFVPDFFQL